jgi:hypothetical protein
LASRKAVKHTAYLFCKSVEHALPAARLNVVSNNGKGGYSRYIYIHLPQQQRPLKVRVSDHTVGLRRALSGECDLFLFSGARPASWAVWLGEIVGRYT